MLARALLVVVPILLTAAVDVRAQSPAFPAGPLKLILPLAAGGATDTLARIASEAAEPALGQPIVIENRPGAGGALAATSVLKATADGHTLLLANFATHTVAPRLLRSVTYDPQTDFAPVVLLASQPHVLLVNPALGISTLAELVAYARANPGKLSYASSGVGSPLHLAGEYLKERAGIDIVHVAYKASGPALLDVIAGRVEVMFDNLSTGLPYVQSGQLKALAVTSATRSPLAPSIPTAIECGLAEFETAGWWGIAAPAGTPRAVVDRLAAAYRQGLADPKVASTLAAQGFTVLAGGPEEFQAFVARDIARWSPVIRSVAALASR